MTKRKHRGTAASARCHSIAVLSPFVSHAQPSSLTATQFRSSTNTMDTALRLPGSKFALATVPCVIALAVSWSSIAQARAHHRYGNLRGIRASRHHPHRRLQHTTTTRGLELSHRRPPSRRENAKVCWYCDEGSTSVNYCRTVAEILKDLPTRQQIL